MAYIERSEAIKAIRTGLRRRSGKAWSVSGDRGTAYGWIKITSPTARLGCARGHDWLREGPRRGLDCRFCGVSYLEVRGDCAAHTAEMCDEFCWDEYMTPEDRAELGSLMGVTPTWQGLSLGPDDRIWAVSAAAGLAADVDAERCPECGEAVAEGVVHGG